ncbi:pseudouridine synthase [Tetragenococcus koreensis]|uniref:Pseudouridine synthase n=1 Tax=Tetragenococcus koreensis TaxID=290335 RepID=A0AAN4RK72_9ENTE|nr:pseudouridine synthase [Tetragenococcus koreensis]MCF1616218.1 rRNA pseudouridine synthase [Tetragenococcus koreensis]MCF1620985.1 rRNA pseudouridine synthase [Tetragenococcus koreensis]MCF1626083.1 rRNA pseudouridine synthase [Tetragenococcus koreensis]MCF1631119.1 rRNA pseudouridine synthase [Tetragenococcus koreensis]MCF1677115.1 rRNA pseudouridine synthase [Tetragenococcus koreensis]
MQRLQKVIAHAGIASRRKAENYITQGRVKVNGEVVKELGVQVSKKDQIEVDQVPIYQEEPVYFMFYKPRGVISAASDDKKRTVVTDYFTDVSQRIYPIGRLDYNTSGLLLLTNDGDVSQKLMHPKHEVDKVYVAKVNGVATNKKLLPVTKGMKIEGKNLAPAKFLILSTDVKTQTSIVQLTIHEGRNHQVKNMLKACGFPVEKLKRERYGNLTLENLKPGDYRELHKNEINRLLEETKIK